MAYQQFMFDEAFEFQDDHTHSTKTNEKYHTEIEDQRLPPLGACSNEDDLPTKEGLDIQSYLQLQEQHEQLNTSLFALTSHFAQVQFRLKQIIHAPKENQEELLNELEDFAFAGCPNVVGPNEKRVACSSCVSHTAIEHYEQRIMDEKEREERLAVHLKKMISDLEHCQKQLDHKVTKKPRKKGGYIAASKNASKYTFDDAEKLEISDDEVDGIPKEDIKKYIDKTMSRLINPKKAKENIITQVSKQITDMEKFVTFLQGYESTTEAETDIEPVNAKAKPKNTAPINTNMNKQEKTRLPAPHTNMLKLSEDKRKRLHEASVAVIKKSLAVLQIFAISQFGCSARRFQDHMMRKSESATASSSGFVEPLAKLRSSIDHIMVLHTKLVDVGGLHPDSEDELNLPISSADRRASWRKSKTLSRERSRDSSISSVTSVATIAGKSIDVAIQEDLIRVVRGDFVVALKELLQHGLCTSFQSEGLSTKALVGCMSSHSVKGYSMHIWDYFSKFYNMKHGDQFNHQPSMMLSEAFAMDVGCTQQTPKQSLLTVLHRIKETHESRKRSFDAMFKALVSAGLNRGRLAQWIRLVIRCPELMEHHYERWSYVVRTGFDDVLTLLEKLSSLTFFLPEDLAIRHLLKSANEFGDA
ncbi:RUN domain-containing protein 1-like [Hydractinia symbiolongicarpus]|uniref:RUN domain-containing protein 1-like n=1 Tax=Hydractinia symbiolongicarpus TaxID=13093 RepID=UPI00254B2D00|nr:RUN domain-containing protein 1-like [Hydractinia symbiolongicarpus]